MPIYEYSCSSCGQDSEILASGYDAEAAVSCEHCGSRDVKKKMSSFAVQSGSARSPECAPRCGDGFSKGTCGSGMCCGGHGH